MIVFTRICHYKRLKPAKSNLHTSYFFSVHFNIILWSHIPLSSEVWEIVRAVRIILGRFKNWVRLLPQLEMGKRDPDLLGQLWGVVNILCAFLISLMSVTFPASFTFLEFITTQYSNLQDKCSNNSSGRMFQYPEINIQIPVFIKCAMSSSDTASRCEMAISSALILKRLIPAV